MATGTTILLHYALCCGFVLLTATTATGLVLWGRHKERKARRDRSHLGPKHP